MTVYALVVGIDDYSPVDGMPLAPLHGSVDDARAMARWLDGRFGSRLVSRLRVAPRPTTAAATTASTSTMTASRSRPTLATVRADLDAIAESAIDGDQAVLYFSGHGARLPTERPGTTISRIERPLDEALVLADAESPLDASILRDVEVGAWIRQLAERGVWVTVIIDACHSGGASKQLASGAVSSLDAELARGVACEEAWLPPTPERAVFLAACQAHQEAHQIFVEGRFRGLLTWALLDALGEPRTAATRSSTWECLHREVVVTAHRRIGHQTPRLEGERLRHLFARSFGAAEPTRIALPGLDVAPEADRQEARIASFRWITRLDNPLSTLWRRLDLRVEHADGTTRPLETWAAPRHDDEPRGFRVESRPGEPFDLILRSRAPRIVHVTVFDLDPAAGWACVQVFPHDAWSTSIEPGGIVRIRTEIERALRPATRSEDRNVEASAELLLVFVATDSWDLRALELAPSRFGIDDSAKELSTIAGLDALRRRLEGQDDPARSTFRDWTVERIYLEVEP